MAKLKKTNQKELTMRVDELTMNRLEWIEFARRKELKFRNDALLEALGEWLDRMEKIHGTDQTTHSSAAKSKRV